MPADSWSTILEMAKVGGAMARAGVPPHLRALAEDCHENAFFITQFASGPRVCRTRAGSRPGESLADMIFGFMYGEVLAKIRSCIIAEGLVDPFPYDGDASPWQSDPVEQVWVTDSTWADDSAFLTRDKCPRRLVERARKLTARVYDLAKMHAMDPNMKAGKTEVMISLRGKGCRQVAREYFAHKEPQLTICTETAGSLSVKVTAAYVHLGFHIDRNVTYGPEVLRRLSQARSALKEIRDVVIQNRHVPHRRLEHDSMMPSSMPPSSIWNSGMRTKQSPGASWRLDTHDYSDLSWPESSDTST